MLISGCEKDNLSIDPKEAILGKWELIQQGTSQDDLSEVPQLGYTEFIDNKSYRYFDYDTEEYDYGDYTINDSVIIYYYYAVENGEIVDTISVSYYHTFRDKRTMALEIDAPAMLRTFIYKKTN